MRLLLGNDDEIGDAKVKEEEVKKMAKRYIHGSFLFLLREESL